MIQLAVRNKHAYLLHTACAIPDATSGDLLVPFVSPFKLLYERAFYLSLFSHAVERDLQQDIKLAVKVQVLLTG